MTDVIETMEIISSTKRIEDLWDGLDRDISPSNFMLRLNDAPTRMRFLGPFVTVKRLWIPTIVRQHTSKKQISAILNNDEDTIQIIYEKIKKAISNNDFKTNIGKKIKKDANDFFTKRHWKKEGFGQLCILVNTLVKYSETSYVLKIMTLTRSICDKFASKSGSTRINGLKACDVTITRRHTNSNPPSSYGAILDPRPIVGTGAGGYQFYIANGETLSSTYYSTTSNFPSVVANPPYDDPPENSMPTFEVEIKEESVLTQPQIDYVLKNGLVDIRAVIHELNNMRNHSYVYKEVSGYRLPNEFTGAIVDELSKMEEVKHIEKVEEEILELPRNAFENANTMREPIASLEVD